MKFIITFCIVLAGCSILTEAALNAEKLLIKLKEQVDLVSNDLETYSSGLTGEVNEKVNQLLSVEMTKIETNLNDTVKEVNERVESAEFQGKQVGHCYETFKAQVEKSEESVKTSFQNCVDDQFEDFSNIQKKIEKHVQTKTTIISELDHTLSACKDSIAYQLCIAKDLPSATALVGGYYTSTLALKESAKIFNYTLSIKMSLCFLKPESTFSLALLSGKMSAEECINNV